MNLIEFVIDNFIDSAYCVGYRFSRVDFWDEEKSTFKLIKPSFRYWYADPIPFEIDGEIYIFMEQYDRLKKIGRIAVSKVNAQGSIDKPKTVIEEKNHLSFPMIAFFKNEYYMIPEASETGSIVIYKMQDSPYSWKRYYSLEIREQIVDIAYCIKDDNTIQLIAGVIEQESNLLVKRKIINLYNLDDLIKINYEMGYEDKEGSLVARNGGSIYFDSYIHKQYRIVQESTSNDYGMYILRNEIKILDLNIIDEKTLDKKTVEDIDIKLNKCFYRKIGIHTYGKCNKGFEVIDVAVTKFSIYPLLRKMGVIKK